MKSRANKYVLDFSLVLGTIGVAVIFWVTGMFTQFGVYLLLILNLLIITLVLRHTTIQKSSREVVDIERFEAENYKKKHYGIKRFLLINRQYLFPTLLVVSLIMILIGQIHLRGLDTTGLFLSFNVYQGNVLLGLVLMSGIATLFQEDVQKKYYKKVVSPTHNIYHLGLSAGLSLLGLYIVFLQTQSIGPISYPISFIAGMLIFLIGIMIIEESGDEKERDEK